MGYKRIAACFIGFNILMLILLIAAGVRYRGSKETGETKEPVQEKRSESVQEDKGKLVSSMGDDFYGEEQPDSEDASGADYLLLLTSVGSDLMIKIADSTGNTVPGKRWVANVTSEDGTEESFPDEDEDGIIYREKMPAGTYAVNVDGAGEASITIRNIVRVTAVTDIRRIVAQESTIDAAKEDTAVNEEAEQEPEEETVIPDFELVRGAVGIDVSKYQKEIDWPRVKSSGIEYAIIRAGYRGSSSGVLVEDPYFERNLAGATAAGLKIGVYFFTQAVNTEEAAEEAQAVASLVSPEDLDLPVYLDVEGSGSANGRADGLDTETRSENIRVFCETLESMGYRAGVYASKSWLTGKIDTSRLDPYDIWLAQYRMKAPDYTGRYSVWQYTSKGHVDGIQGNVDLDLIVK